MATNNTFGLGPLERVEAEYLGLGQSLQDSGRGIAAGQQPQHQEQAMPNVGQAGMPQADTRQPTTYSPGQGQDGLLPPPNLIPLFESAARKHNVPVNVIMALGHQESRYNDKAVGVQTQWGQAKGMMQYLDSTAKMMGINPYIPEQSIDAAAKQIRQRLDKGYTMDDAVMEHFAGPDRKLWKEKTKQYGSDVLGKARAIADQMYPVQARPGEGDRFNAMIDRTANRTQGNMSTVQDGPMSIPAGTDQAELAPTNTTDGQVDAPTYEDRNWFERYVSDRLGSGWKGLQAGVAGGAAAFDQSVIDMIERVDAGQAVPEMADPIGYQHMNEQERAQAKESMGQAFIGAIGDMATAKKAQQAIPQNPTVAAAMQSKTFGEFWEHFTKAPMTFIANVGVESLPAMAPGLVLGGAAGVATRAAGGFAAGMGAGSYGVDYQSSVIEALQEAGVDPTNQAALQTAFNDKTLMEQVRKSANAHATMVGAFDGASGGIAGKAIVSGTTVARKMANAGAQMPVQGAMGAGGEAAGQFAQGKELEAGPIASEFFGEMATAPVDVAVAGMSKQPATEYADGLGDAVRVPQEETPQSPPAAAAPVPDAPTGPTGRAARAGEEAAFQQSQVAPQGMPPVGTQVALAPEGIEPVIVTIDGYVGSDVSVRDQAGNAMQIPLAEAMQFMQPVPAQPGVDPTTGEIIQPEAKIDGVLPEPAQGVAEVVEPTVDDGVAVAEQTAEPQPILKIDHRKMSLEQLQERQQYLADQARNNGGWNKKLAAEKSKVDAAISRLQPIEAVAPDAPVSPDPIPPNSTELELPAAPGITPRDSGITTQQGKPLVELFYPAQGVHVLVRKDQWEEGVERLPSFTEAGTRATGTMQNIPRNMLDTPIERAAPAAQAVTADIENPDVPESAYSDAGTGAIEQPTGAQPESSVPQSVPASQQDKANRKQEFTVAGRDPHSITYEHRPDGRLARTITYPDGEQHIGQLVTDKHGDQHWVSNERYEKGEYYPVQLSEDAADQHIIDDLRGKDVVGSAPEPQQSGAEPQTPEIVRVRDVYGTDHYVDRAELEGDSPRLRRHTKDGKRLSSESGSNIVLRENLDPDGSKAAEAWKDLPYIAGKNDRPFKSEGAARNAIKRLGQNVDDFELRRLPDGIVAVRKGAQPEAAATGDAAPTGENAAPETTAQGEGLAQDSGDETPSEPKPKTISKDDADHLFGIPKKREAALKRIDKGTAYFSTKQKADEWITKNGLKDTHEVVQNGKRFDVVAKGETESTPQQGVTDQGAWKKGDIVGVRFTSPDRVERMRVMDGPLPHQEWGWAYQVTDNNGSVLVPESRLTDAPTQPVSIKKEPGITTIVIDPSATQRATAPTAGEVLFDENGTMHRVESVDADTGAVRVTRNPDSLSEQVVRMDADRFERLRAEDAEYRSASQASHGQAATTGEVRQPQTLDNLIGDVDAGYRAHFDYAGADGRTLWIEDTGNGWVLKSKDDDSTTVGTKGGVGQNVWDKARALKAAEDEARYRFTEWKPVVESATEQPAPDADALLNARNDLIDLRTQAEAQGQIADDRLLERVRRQEALVRELEKERSNATPSLSSQLAGMSNAELAAMIDEVAAENAQVVDTAKPIAKRARRTKPKSGKAAPREQVSAPEAADVSDTADVDRTAGEIAQSLGYNVSSAGMEAIKGLTELFGGSGRLNSGLTFDEETYAKAKPHFQAMLTDAQAAGKDIRDFIGLVLQKFGTGVKPYIIRFANDQRDEPQSGADNARDAVHTDGTGPLEEVEASDVQGVEGERGTEPGSAGSEQVGVTPDSATDAVGVSKARGRGSRAARNDTATPRRRVKKPDAEQQLPSLFDVDPAVEVAQASAPNIPAINFAIDDSVELGKGTEGQKYQDNVAAIKALKQIEQENRRATPQEQRTLARYVGWGGLKNAFRVGGAKAGEGVSKGWEKRVDEIDNLLTPDELRAARNSTTAAHYTSQSVVNAVWKGAQRLGFHGGSVLEPSVGTGNFIGLMPQAVRGQSQIMAVEYDSLTARIAQQLYPQSTVLHAGLQSVPLPRNYFALAIGNPPFGRESLTFPHNPSINGKSIHNQFFLASLDALTEGGVMGMVVSHNLMDALGKDARLDMARRAEFMGAVRLPDTAFKENARTEVVTDILFFRKRSDSDVKFADEVANTMKGYKATLSVQEKIESEGVFESIRANIESWVESQTVRDPAGTDAQINVNAYFLRNPKMVVGKIDASGTMNARADLNVRLDDQSQFEPLLNAAIDMLPKVEPRDDVKERSLAHYATVADAMRLAVGRAETGAINRDADGKLKMVVDMDGGNLGKSVMREIELTADTPFNEEYTLTIEGNWQRTIDVIGEDGKPVKVMGKNDKLTNRNEKKVVSYEKLSDIPANDKWGEARIALVTDMLPIRNLMKRQLMLESRDANDRMIEDNRTRLNNAYDKFVEKHGPLHASKVARIALQMPDGALSLAAETVTGKGAATKYGKADIMSRRVTMPPKKAERADTPADAVAISLSEYGAVNVDYVAELLGIDEAGAIDALSKGDSPLAYMNPESQQWESTDQYLSGLVRRKLHAAKEAGLEANIKALEAVMPEAWDSSQITPNIGSAWIPGPVYADFLKHIGYGKANVSYSPVTNTFDARAEGEPAAQWATSGRAHNALNIVSRLLNSQPMKVTFTDGEGKTHVDEEATAESQIKASEVFNEFLDWAYTDDARRSELVEIFNEKYNTRLVRQYDGSHLRLPGKVPDALIKMRRHQNNAIWRGIIESEVLYDHVVGAGKTYTAIARIMERRRMGLSRKPVVIVPNHLVEVWADDAHKLYPGANVLVAGKADFERKNRRRLFARIASGDYDMVILGHSSFGFIDIDQATEQRYIEEELESAYKAIVEAQEAADEAGYSGFRKPMGVTEAERLVKKLEERLAKLREGKRDRLLTFEEMGVDDLTVDEAHEFKNLAYNSKLSGVAGMGNKTGSQKAMDLHMKIRSMRERKGTSVAFLTGTPISNSVAEMFLVLRNLVPHELKQMGIDNFDAWRSMFVSYAAAYEPTEAGGIKEVTRLGREWMNMKTLMDLYYSVSDAVTIDDIKVAYAADNPGQKFPVPVVKSQREGNGDRAMVAVKPSPEQKVILRDIVAGFDGLKGISDLKERNATRLRLMDKARKVSLDPRAVDPMLEVSSKDGKIPAVVDNVTRMYRKWDADKGTQIVFLDRSVPKSKGDDKVLAAYDALVEKMSVAMEQEDTAAEAAAVDALEKYNVNEMEELRNAAKGGWNAYQEIKNQLVSNGIPESEIRFVQEANTDIQKKALFDLVKSGEVRVIIGSTPRMGAGTNVQDRLVGLHHVDVTWKPSDIEQREGRIVRQGNLFAMPPSDSAPNPLYKPDFEVEVIAYATEMTVDAKMWSLNATKLKAINGIRKYDGSFLMEFEDAESANMAEMAALATGNPLMVERVTLAGDIQKLELQQRSYKNRVNAMRDSLNRAKRMATNGPGESEAMNAYAEAIEAAAAPIAERSAQRSITIQGKAYSDIGDASFAAQEAVKKARGGDDKARFAIEVGGLNLTSRDSVDDAINKALGNHGFEGTIDGEVFIGLNDAAKALTDKVGLAVVSAGSSDIMIDGLTVNGMKVEIDVSTARFSKSGHDKDITFHLVNGNGAVMGHYRSTLNGGVPTQSGMRAGLSKLLDKLSPAQYRHASKQVLNEARAAEKKISGLDEQVNKPWDKAKELEDNRNRLKEVIAELEGASDSTRLGDDATPDTQAPEAPATDAPDADTRYSVADAITAGPIGPVFDKLIASGHVVVHATAAAAPGNVRGAIQGYTDKDGTINLIAGNLTAQTAMPVLLHEAFHAGTERLIGTAKWDSLNGQLARYYEAAKRRKAEGRTQAGDYWDGALSRVETARKQGAVSDARLAEEFGAYAIEEFERAPAGIKKWAENVIGMVKDWLARRFGIQAGAITPAQLRAMAVAALRNTVKASPATGPKGGQPVMASVAGASTDLPAFKSWFKGSKVVDQAGRPMVVYHGTSADFTIFDSTKADEREPGIFFTVDKGVAEDYAGDGGRVIEAFLSIHKPYRMTNDERVLLQMDADSFHEEGINGFIKELQGDGYDGIFIEGDPNGQTEEEINDQWISFRPEQIKSALSNEGTFDPANADIRYSIKDDASNTDAHPTESSIKSWVSDKLTGMNPSLLATIPLNYFEELARPSMKGVVKAYMKNKRAMDAYRGRKHGEADETAQKWLKLRAMNRKAAKSLASIMHDSTVAQDDPTLKGGSVELRNRFNALPAEAKALYREVRDTYLAQSKELDEILIENVSKAMDLVAAQAERRYNERVQEIKDSGLTGADKADAEESALRTYRTATTTAAWSQRARITKLRQAFESNRIEGPYFPLARFGQYFVTMRDVDGKVVSFSRRESPRDMTKLEKQLRQANPGMTVETGMLSNKSEIHGAMDPRFVAEVEEILSGASIDDVVKDQVWQRYLESMPDMSTRKRFIHRKGTEGYEQDALRSFSHHMFHAAHQMAKLKYGPEMLEQVNQVEDKAKVADDQVRAMQLANELRKRNEWVMNPTGSKFSQAMTSTAFVWFLGVTPAAAIVNLSQTALLGVPIIGARYGVARASANLLIAAKDFVVGMGSTMNAKLTADEKAAMQAAYDSGLVDKSQAHDLAGVGETGVEYSALRQKVMSKISWFFHNAEKFNREVTALAAYRSARQAGEGHDQAIDAAHDLTWKTHFDYSNSNRPRVMQSDVAKIALVFRNFQINMLYRLFRDIHQSFKGETAQAKKEARMQLVGIMGMMGLNAGVKGLPFFSLAMILLGAAFDDEDDPFTAEDRLRADLLDVLGPELGGLLLNGVPGHYLGIDLTGRIGMPDLWFRSSNRELEGEAEFDYWLKQTLGASVGMIGGMIRGASIAYDGQVARGIETAAPKAIKDQMKAWRYANEGATTIKGEQYIGKDDLSAWNIASQSIGFTPAVLVETYERNTALKNAETRIKDRRRSLLNHYALSRKLGDDEGNAEVRAKIKEFNKAFPEVRITGQTLVQSLRARRNTSGRTTDGLILDKRLDRGLRKEMPDYIYRDR